MRGGDPARGSGFVEVRRLGVVPYAEALAMQKALVEERRAGRIPNLLLLLQHPPVITLGVRKSSRNNVTATEAQLASRGVEVHDSGRGGDVTYHRSSTCARIAAMCIATCATSKR